MGDAISQLSLLGDLNDTFCQQHCFAFAKCGGGYATAPCQCAWKMSSPSYRNCGACYLVCLQREVAARNRPVDNARQQYIAGLDWQDLALSQHIEEDFPLFIPVRTADFPVGGGLLPLRWAAADGTQVIERILAGRTTAPKFASPNHVRTYLRVTDECRLLAIMNTQDKLLERFWAMRDRVGKFQRLATYGFELSTGATFSVTEDTTENTPVPRFHNLVMQRRHLRVVKEIQQAGLTSVPNLYWLDEREKQKWITWFTRNPTVRYVSRDFTRTRQGTAFEERLTALIRMLNQVGRPFHIFLVGPGPAVAARALSYLAAYGHTGTIITSDPILQGIKGKLYDATFRAAPAPAKTKPDVVLENIELFETQLLNAVSDFSSFAKASRNLVLAST
jgi:hypothetical protein